MRKYEFSRDLLGDIAEGRPNLGETVGLDTYRLLMYTVRDVLEQRLGTAGADEILFEAGKLAGAEFYRVNIGATDSLEDFVKKAQVTLRSKGIGVLRIEEVDLDKGRIVLCVDEDLDCSGLPELEYEVCIYDEGFISSLLECFSGQSWSVKEIDCWCTGDRTCRFEANLVGAAV